MSAPFEKAVSTSEYQRPLDLRPFPEFGEDYLPTSVHIHFHFTPHRHAEHFDEAAELIKEADIFAAENAGWSSRALRDINAVSKGDLKVLTKLKESHVGNPNAAFANATLDSLYRTYKPVVFIDADENHKDLLVGNFGRHYKRGIGKDPEATLNGLADALAMVAQSAYRRNLAMADALGPRISEIVSRHPKLSSKEQVRVLFLVGWGHNQLFKALVESPATQSQVSASYWANLYMIDPETTLVMRYMRGGKPTRSEMENFMVAQALDKTVIPALGSKSVYRFEDEYLRSPSQLNLIGKAMIGLMLSMGEDGLRLAQKIHTNALQTQDKVSLMELAITASKQVGQTAHPS